MLVTGSGLGPRPDTAALAMVAGTRPASTDTAAAVRATILIRLLPGSGRAGRWRARKRTRSWFGDGGTGSRPSRVRSGRSGKATHARYVTMGSTLKSATVAFLAAAEGAEQAELLEPWRAVLEQGGHPVLISDARDKIRC